MRVTFATVGHAAPSAGAQVRLHDGRVFKALPHTYTVPPRWWQPRGWEGWLYTATLDGLTPSTSYTYTVSTASSENTSTFTFKTAPLQHVPAATTVFATWGDMGTYVPLGYAVMDKVAEQHTASAFDFVLHQGDISYAGMDTSIPG